MPVTSDLLGWRERPVVNAISKPPPESAPQVRFQAETYGTHDPVLPRYRDTFESALTRLSRNDCV